MVMSMPSVMLQPRENSVSVPQWFADRQRSAWQRFLSLPTPRRGDEAWRFANVSELDFSAFHLASADARVDDSDLIERSQAISNPLAKLVFFNDGLIFEQSRLPAEVVLLPLAAALQSHGELVQQHFMTQPAELGSAKYAALHEAQCCNGVFLWVPEGVVLDGCIEIDHWLGGEGSSIFPHSLLIVAAGAKVKVLERYASLDEHSPGLVIAVNDVRVQDGGALDYIGIQSLNEQSKMLMLNHSETLAQGSSTHFCLHTGCSWVRTETMSCLRGSGARSNMLAVTLPHADQEMDQRTYQHHASPGTFSDLLHKNTLHDESRTVFSGLIDVDEGAHQTDAYQTCRNLFMSDDAEAHSMPGLEINADDVKCSHGSTSAQISDEEILYLRARGIPSQQARELIARGFAAEAIERIHDEALEQVVWSHVDAKWQRILAKA